MYENVLNSGYLNTITMKEFQQHKGSHYCRSPWLTRQKHLSSSTEGFRTGYTYVPNTNLLYDVDLSWTLIVT